MVRNWERSTVGLGESEKSHSFFSALPSSSNSLLCAT